jgi:hypothetical protein
MLRQALERLPRLNRSRVIAAESSIGGDDAAELKKMATLRFEISSLFVISSGDFSSDMKGLIRFVIFKIYQFLRLFTMNVIKVQRLCNVKVLFFFSNGMLRAV